MNKIYVFLNETWQLFYWSFFCPSLLQQRMNKWTSSNNAFGIDILLTSSRFVIQYLLVSIILSFFLVGLIALSGGSLDWRFCLTASLISYSLGIFFLPSGIGFCIPLLMTLIYWQQSNLFTKAFQSLSLTQPKLFTGIDVGSLVVALNTIIIWILVQKSQLSFARYIFCFNSGLSVFIASWTVSKNWLFTILATILTIASTLFISDLWNLMEEEIAKVSGVTSGLVFGLISGIAVGIESCVAIGTESTLAFSVAVVVTSIVAFLVTGIVTTIVAIIAGGIVYGCAEKLVTFVMEGVVDSVLTSRVAKHVARFMELCVGFCVAGFISISVAGFVASIVTISVAICVDNFPLLPFNWFLTTYAVIATSISVLKKEWLSAGVAMVFISFGWVQFNFNTFWVVPVSLISYYRIFPDYLFASLLSLLFTHPLRKQLALEPATLLTKLPPYTTELLWIPLFNHAQILVDTFHQDTHLGLTTLQKMEVIALPGFQLTLQKALSSIIANQLSSIRTTMELINSVTFILPLLSLITRTGQDKQYLSIARLEFKLENSEIGLFFPSLQKIAKDTEALLRISDSALQERGLKRSIDVLKSLSRESHIKSNTKVAKRWKPVITRWRHILEQELAEQQKNSQEKQKPSQGGLLNPFQIGNPLRKDGTTIFKGRQAFANQLVRLILDRNRPTLVLHGPRRAGKTSFLLNLPRLLPSDLIPIYLDMQQSSMTNSEGDFCYGLVRAIHRDTRSQGLQIPSLPSRQDFATQPYPILEDWLESALSQLGERRLLLNLDEFEKIGSAIKEQRISDRLFDQLRSMIQHDDRLGFLFSGVQTLEELGPRWSNYFISVVPMEMHYLEPAEAEDLLLNPDPEFTLRYDPGIVDEILTLTRCQPYLLQLIGFALVTEANRQQTQTATTELLQAAIQSAFTNGEPYFTNIWTEFTGTTPNEVAAGQNLLLALARGNSQSPIICDEATTAASRRLIRYHVIERINENIDINASSDSLPEILRERQASQYENRTNITWEPTHHHIEIPLFEQWVKERAIKI